MQHPFITAALAEQHQADLRRQADHWRLAQSARAARPPRRSAIRRWWRPAARQLRPEQPVVPTAAGPDAGRAATTARRRTVSALATLAMIWRRRTRSRLREAA